MSLKSPANAKINLFLHITGRRANGYHELDSLAVFASTADTLELTLAEGVGGRAALSIEGPFGAGLQADEGNLVLRAAAVLRDKAKKADLSDLSIRLMKNLPVASGIGGGSADAAAALRMISQAWGLDCLNLEALGETLGADVPVCVAGRPRRMQGIGEILSDVPPLPRCFMVLVNPGVPVATPAVFKAWRASEAPFTPAAELSPRWDTFDAMISDLERTHNDLQAPAIALCPVIGDVLAVLRSRTGCALARMSGSGATCFGLFEREADALAASAALLAKGWWSDAGLWSTGGAAGSSAAHELGATER